MVSVVLTRRPNGGQSTLRRELPRCYTPIESPIFKKTEILSGSVTGRKQQKAQSGQYNRVTERFRFFSKDDLPLQPNAPPITLVTGLRPMIKLFGLAPTLGFCVTTNSVTHGVITRRKMACQTMRFGVSHLMVRIFGRSTLEAWLVAFLWSKTVGIIGKSHQALFGAPWVRLLLILNMFGFLPLGRESNGLTNQPRRGKLFLSRDGLGHSETNDIFIDDDYVWITAWGDASRYNRCAEEWESISEHRTTSRVTFGIHPGIDGFWMLYDWLDWGDPIASKYHYSTRSWSELKTPRIGRRSNYREPVWAPRQLIETSENIWLATEGAGIGRYNKASKDWRFLNYETGLASNGWLRVQWRWTMLTFGR